MSTALTVASIIFAHNQILHQRRPRLLVNHFFYRTAHIDIDYRRPGRSAFIFAASAIRLARTLPTALAIGLLFGTAGGHLESLAVRATTAWLAIISGARPARHPTQRACETAGPGYTGHGRQYNRRIEFNGSDTNGHYLSNEAVLIKNPGNLVPTSREFNRLCGDRQNHVRHESDTGICEGNQKIEAAHTSAEAVRAWISNNTMITVNVISESAVL